LKPLHFSNLFQTWLIMAAQRPGTRSGDQQRLCFVGASIYVFLAVRCRTSYVHFIESFRIVMLCTLHYSLIMLFGFSWNSDWETLTGGILYKNSRFFLVNVELFFESKILDMQQCTFIKSQWWPRMFYTKFAIFDEYLTLSQKRFKIGP